MECIGSDEIENLKSYAEELFSDEAINLSDRYNVLLCRRSLVVFAIFCYIYKIPFTNKVLCSDDLSPLKSGDNVLIIDDIIHGRTVKRLFSILKDRGINVNISAFYKKNNAEFLDEDDLKFYTYSYGRDVTENEWHDFSNRLIKLILRGGIPYTTFTYSFASTVGTTLKNPQNYTPHCVEQTTMKDAGMALEVFFDTQFKTNFKLLNQLCNYVCIRKYTLEDSTVVHTPFVFIPVLNSKSFNLLGEAFLKIEIADPIIHIFKNDIYSLEYKARFLSFLLSYAYGVVSLDKGVEDIKRTSIIKSIIQKSFLSTFDSVLNLSEKQCFEILNLDLDFDNDVPVLSENIDFFTEYSFESSTLNEELITSAISALHLHNEKRVYERKDSSWGYRFIDISKSMKGNYKLVSFLISMWDIGKSSYCFRECGEWVYSCITDGEQSYRINHQAFAPYTRTISLIQSSLPFFEHYTFDTLFEKIIAYLKNSCNDIQLSIEELKNCSDFLKNRSVADLNVDGSDSIRFDKLYERTQKFLRDIHSNDKQ